MDRDFSRRFLMSISLPCLPYGLNDLEPYMSKRTLELHHGKHHRAYVEKANKLIQGTPYDDLSPEELIVRSYIKNKKIFNQAAQAWNHSFFWECLSPRGEGAPTSDVRQPLEKDFGSFEKFRDKFTQKASTFFGSGWVWLVQDKDHSLSIVAMQNAGNPLAKRQVPLLVCDIWEHAYYVDYQNERPKYLENFWKLVNWKFVQLNLERSSLF